MHSSPALLNPQAVSSISGLAVWSSGKEYFLCIHISSLGNFSHFSFLFKIFIMKSRKSFYFFLSFFFCFLGLYPQHMEVPRLRVQSELQLPAYTTATAMEDPSQLWDLHHSSRQHWILNRVRPGIEPVTSWFLVGFISAVLQQELLKAESLMGRAWELDNLLVKV